MTETLEDNLNKIKGMEKELEDALREFNKTTESLIAHRNLFMEQKKEKLSENIKLAYIELNYYQNKVIIEQNDEILKYLKEIK